MNLHKKLCILAIGIFCILSATVSAQTNPPLWSPTESYKAGDLVTYGGVTFQCLINETSSHPSPHTQSWDVNFVYNGTFLINVGPGQPFPTINSAWIYIKYARIALGASIVLNLESNYFETFASSFSLNHPFGSQISIKGNNTGQQAHFSSASKGFTLDSGHVLADLEGFQIIGPNGGTQGNAAIDVETNAVVSKLQNLTIQNFDVGLYASLCGCINNVQQIQLNQLAGGAQASSNATINFTAAVTFNGLNTSAATPPQFGFLAQGGTINCAGCTANNCIDDFSASHGGRLEADNSHANSSTAGGYHTCYFAVDHGFIHAVGAIASGAQECFSDADSGFIDAQNSTTSGYAVYGYYSVLGGVIDARGHSGGTGATNGSADGSYIYGL